MDALQVEAETGRRVVEAEALHQPVVAAAAAEDAAERRVVHLEDGAAVVAQVPQQTEVNLDPLGSATALELLVGLAEARDRPLDGLAAQPPSLLENLLATADLG